MGEPKLYALALFAIKVNSASTGKYQAVLSASSTLADSVAEAKRIGLALLHQECPAAAGWLKHACTAALAEESSAQTESFTAGEGSDLEWPDLLM